MKGSAGLRAASRNGASTSLVLLLFFNCELPQAARLVQMGEL